MFSSLFMGSVVTAIAEALGPAGDGAVAVLDEVRMARGLDQRGHRVVLVGERPKSARRLGALPVHERLDELPREELAGLVGLGVGQRDDWSEVLALWMAAVAEGGVVVLVDRAPAMEMTRRALCGGLIDIGQRHAGRTVVTSGRVPRF